MKNPKVLKTVRKTTIAVREDEVADREEPILQKIKAKTNESRKTLAERIAQREARTRDIRQLRGIVKSPSFCTEASRGRTPEIVYCDCSIFDPAIEDIANALCGCGKRHLRLYRDEVIHGGANIGACNARFVSRRRLSQRWSNRAQNSTRLKN